MEIETEKQKPENLRSMTFKNNGVSPGEEKESTVEKVCFELGVKERGRYG